MVSDSPLFSRLNARGRYRLILGPALFLAALLPRALNLGLFFAPDERYIWQVSNEFALALSRGDLGSTAITAYPGLPLMWIETLAAAAKLLWAGLFAPTPLAWAGALGLDTPIALLAEKELALGLVHVALVMLAWRWLEALFGRGAAFVAAMLIALDPFLLAESRVVRMEVLTAEFMSLAVLALLVYLRRARRRLLLLSGLFAGLATLTKISSLFLLPFIGLALAIYVARREFPRWGEAARRIAADYLYWLLAAAATFVALWPVLWVRPGPAIRLLWDYVSQAGGEGFAERGVFFWGQIFPDDPGPAFYPVALAFRVGPLVLPGLVILAALAIARLRRGRVRLPGSAFNVGALAAFALSYIVFMSLGALKYDRYLLPVFPALNALAGFGLWRGALALSRLTKAKNRAMMAAAAMLPLLLAQAAVCRNVHPYYYAYYNPWLGGIRQAQNMVWVGHGEGIERVAAYLDAKPETETVRLASAMSSKFEPLFAGQTIPMSNLDGRWVQADYVFIYISQLKRGKHDPEILDYLARREPEYRLNLQGIEFGTLYPGPAAQFYSGSKLEGRGALYGYTLGETQLRAGTTLTATLYWRNEGRGPDDVFWVRLVDAAGYPWAEAISQPRPGFEEAARIRKAIVESEAALALPIGMPPGDYVLQMGFAADGGATVVGMFSLSPGGDDVRVTLPDSFPVAVAAPHPLALATGDLQLLGYDLSPEAAAPGERGWLTLYWRAAQNAPRDYVIAVQLLDAGGQEAAYWLGRPVYSGSPTDTWVQGQIVQDPWELSLPAAVPPGDYRLELALYDAATADMVARAPLGPWIIAAP